MDALQVRAAAAHQLVEAGLIDFELALAFVIFPSEEVESASAVVAAAGERRHGYSDAQKRRALDLVDAGYSWAQAGREVGVPKPTIGTWVRRRRQ